MLDPVRSAQMVDRVEGYPVLLHRVSAEVRPEAVIDRDNPAVVLEPDADLMHLFTVMAGRHEMLVAALDPLDRSAQAQSQGGHQDLFRVHLPLRAKRATDIRRDDAQPLLCEPEHFGDRLPHVVGMLGGRDHDEGA